MLFSILLHLMEKQSILINLLFLLHFFLHFTLNESLTHPNIPIKSPSINLGLLLQNPNADRSVLPCLNRSVLCPFWLCQIHLLSASFFLSASSFLMSFLFVIIEPPLVKKIYCLNPILPVGLSILYSINFSCQIELYPQILLIFNKNFSCVFCWCL